MIEFEKELEQRVIRKELEESVRKRLAQVAEKNANRIHEIERKKERAIKSLKGVAYDLVIIIAACLVIYGTLKLFQAMDRNAKADYSAAVTIPKEDCVYYVIAGWAPNFIECKFESPALGSCVFVGTLEYPIKVECE